VRVYLALGFIGLPNSYTYKLTEI